MISHELRHRLRYLGVVPVVAMAEPQTTLLLARALPTGVNPKNLEAYLSCTSVTAVGGTWIARAEDPVVGNWQEIRGRCEAARKTVEQLHAAVTP